MQGFDYLAASLAPVGEQQQNPAPMELASRVLLALDTIQQIGTFFLGQLRLGLLQDRIELGGDAIW